MFELSYLSTSNYPIPHFPNPINSYPGLVFNAQLLQFHSPLLSYLYSNLTTSPVALRKAAEGGPGHFIKSHFIHLKTSITPALYHPRTVTHPLLDLKICSPSFIVTLPPRTTASST